jgi:hypothetical protein
MAAFFLLLPKKMVGFEVLGVFSFPGWIRQMMRRSVCVAGRNTLLPNKLMMRTKALHRQHCCRPDEERVAVAERTRREGAQSRSW